MAGCGLRAAGCLGPWGVGRWRFYAYSRRTAPPAETAHRSCKPSQPTPTSPQRASRLHRCWVAAAGWLFAIALDWTLSYSSCLSAAATARTRPSHRQDRLPAYDYKEHAPQRKHTETPAVPSPSQPHRLASNHGRHGEFASHTCRRRRLPTIHGAVSPPPKTKNMRNLHRIVRDFVNVRPPLLPLNTRGPARVSSKQCPSHPIASNRPTS